MTNTQKRLLEVLENIKKMSIENEYDAEMFLHSVDSMLDEINQTGVFGEDGILDPRLNITAIPELSL